MIFGHCDSDDTRTDLEDNNNTAKLSNLFGFSTLTQKEALLEVEMLKAGVQQ